MVVILRYYVICALPSSSFSIHNLKNHQKIPCKRQGKQTFFCKQTQLAILKQRVLYNKTRESVDAYADMLFDLK